MNNYFCVMPFYGYEYPHQGWRDTPCCFLAPGTDINAVRQDMLNQKRPAACQACWKLEDQGITSDRQLKNAAFDYYANKDISAIEDECQQGNYSIRIVKLYTSTVCNSTCMTCSEEASSTWAKLKNIPIKYSKLPEQKLDSIDYQNLKMLSFVGGEPLYEMKNFEILEKLIQANNTNCFISLVTNGSVKLSTQQIAMLRQFNNLNFCLSIDGINSVYEYVRFPSNWHLLLENIELYKSLGINLTVSYTISNLNIFSYDETTDWFNNQGLSYNHNIVSSPEYFSPNSLPKSVKDTLSANFLLNPHRLSDDVNFKRFVQEVGYQDQLKNISIRDYIPELAVIIDQNT